jgi:hypothetical protein
MGRIIHGLRRETGGIEMTFDPDKALQKARESVHGFYMDGPSEAESRIEHLERVVSALFRQERKLKLERLMYKAFHLGTWEREAGDQFDWADRCLALSERCKKELEELKK